VWIDEIGEEKIHGSYRSGTYLKKPKQKWFDKEDFLRRHRRNA
jgi:hypothetical protein